jgi:DNA invertase Pin-like site-specific DNA recombinase
MEYTFCGWSYRLTIAAGSCILSLGERNSPQQMGIAMHSAVIYCRISDETASEETGERMETQEAACRAYCEEKGYNVLEVVRENASGARLDRPGVDAAIEHIRRGAARLVIYKYDRLARSMAHQAVLIHRAEETYGGVVEAVKEPYDPGDPTTAIRRALTGYVAEMERSAIAERTARGTRARVERGKMLGAPVPLFGYRWADDVKERGARSIFEVDEVAAATVRRIFDMCLSGRSLLAIAETFNREGVPTPSAYHAQNGKGGRRAVGANWYPAQVRRILTERAYMGKHAAYRMETVKERVRGADGTMRTRKRQQKRSDTVALPDTPAIVTEAAFHAAQDQLKSNIWGATRRNKHPEASLLRSGFIVCGHCDANMGAMSDSKGGYNYRCYHRKGSVAHGVCPVAPTMMTHLLDREIWDAISVAALQPQEDGMSLAMRAFLRYTSSYFAEGVRLRSRQTETAGTVKSLEEQRDNFLASIGQTSNAAIRARLVFDVDKLQEQLDELAGRSDTLSQDQAQHQYEGERQRAFLETIGRFKDVASWTYEEKRQALRALGVKVKLYASDHDPRWEITYNWETVRDRMDTDIIAGTEAGMRTILVLSGVTQIDQVPRFPYRPTEILESIGQIVV